MRPAFAFDFEWRITLFTLLLLPLLISLGFWQLQRAEEKAAIALAFEAKRHSPPALLAEIADRSPAALAYLRVKLRGAYWAGQDFLLDNRMQAGKYGNEVLTVFELEDGELVLVNRGWVLADPGRMSRPQVPPVPAAAELTGQVYVSPGEPYLLAEQHIGGDWPRQIQAFDSAKIAASMGVASGTVFPYPVRLDAGQPGSLSVDWKVINSSPAKHRGYAVQWFSMAAALALIYILRSTNLWRVIRGAPRVGAQDE